MAGVVFTEPAEYDLLDIENYIFATPKRRRGYQMESWALQISWQNILKRKIYSNLNDTPKVKRIGGFLQYIIIMALPG